MEKVTSYLSYIILIIASASTFSSQSKAQIAVKTNLLYDAVGALNAGIEIPIKEKFSWNADIAYAYWRTSNSLYALQTLEYGTEFKFWPGIGKKTSTHNIPLHGWNIGIYGRYWQRYDVQWKDGFQGNGVWSTGVTGGYAFPISNQLALECSIGGGWLYVSKYRHYHRPEYGPNGRTYLMWKETGKWNGLSITKISLSLIWHIQRSKKGGTKE